MITGTNSGADEDFLAESRDHRYGEQLRFIARFPAYATIVQPEGVTWWYRRREAPAVLRLTKDPENQGVRVQGDVEVGRRVMRQDAAPLPDGIRLEGLPAVHRRLFDQYGGIRPVVFADPFEGVAWAILGQQITVGFAAQLKNAVAARYGTMIPEAGANCAVFPSASVLSRVHVDDLRTLKLSRQKAETLIAVARAIDDGKWDWSRLSAMPSQEAYEVLIKMKGIGPWTAEYCLLRVFGHPDVLPAGDVALRRAWARISDRPVVSESDLRHGGAVWRGMRSDFAFWLWLDNFRQRHGGA
ncbi:DNA-3-methyladenine glycosylase family protein [Sulfobacillus harzensis]|uniref:DNA-3-methyladenine glycosylase II n=1 Tax=Sulfobacillus harzensis TaxID=2729629 RepID=A0A7Y0L8T0_9FIRM|nr:DNA-3-methyladenine glycosylase 2 family protein [Sulfobacillus harzensis]NMP24926.1 DNA-3-methyladenine glycosylase 2 family protein [Sulfobacillus harzensis]